MTTIKPTQIVTDKTPTSTQSYGLPRDLSVVVSSTDVANTVVDFTTTSVDESDQSSADLPTNTDNVNQLYVPIILGINQQTVNQQSDGTATIDVVLSVSSDPAVVEYDVRISKSAGNL